MDIEQIHANAANFVKQELERLNFPQHHPFNDYPLTPESMALEMIVLLKIFTNENDLIISFLKKCKSIEHGTFSYTKYNQNINEVIWLYYLYVGLIETDSINLLTQILDENTPIYDNGKKFEYSLLLSGDGLIQEFLVNSEVKTLTCDPFEKENGLKAIDGQKLIKPFFPDLRNADELYKDEGAIILQSSTYYYQTAQNIKRIINKCRGNNVSGYLPFNIGVLFINSSTSIEEFYSYLFHKSKGVYSKLLTSNVDALVLVSMDARNDLKLENIYSMGYVQTALINPSESNKKICERLRIDNFISLGEDVDPDIYELGQREFGYYKILFREKLLNIIPYDATEEEIIEYLEYLKSNNIRY